MNTIRVVPPELQASARRVTDHAEELAARLAASTGRIAEAHTGVPTIAATALSTALAKWQRDTTALDTRLAAHAQALGDAATTFGHRETSNAGAVQRVAGRAGDTAVER
ncbi:WXG100 family type VII secretion target [Mycobacterium sp. MYCO198283]|uniref:WXG100 family type VII secretion target n=1 Tax=Mycobacterium sp. MYCO198283 TaxID=2883505 RepID=UPI001E4B5141|nr:WXG100 family type VII secretion target [Mycobacterium sp. MYCO198283]MCG5433560.1 WXG100 family type VII secretion target [Mycobacterium sp. MYCO198283]